jgi:flavin reductase (DIM6/NTAB) family NADH-FMN oxidoreductase RutF
MAVDPDRFKGALRRWASGVTIITTSCDGEDAGMTVSAFSSVSLEPPLVLACADKASNTNPLIARSGSFAANILAAGQEQLSNRFATTGNEAVRFEGLECKRGPSGAPWLPGALAVMDCRVSAAHDAGDHVIYVGEVLDVDFSDRDPLLYFDARYRGLATSS